MAAGGLTDCPFHRGISRKAVCRFFGVLKYSNLIGQIKGVNDGLINNFLPGGYFVLLFIYARLFCENILDFVENL